MTHRGKIKTLSRTEKVLLVGSFFILALFFTLFYLRKKDEANPNLVKKGFVFLRKGKFKKAKHTFNKAISYDPASYGAYLGLGRAYFEEQNMELALKYFLKANKIKPNDPNIINYIGAVYHSKGEYEKAISYFKKAVAIDHKFWPAYDNLGFAHFYLGNLREAKKFFNLAIKYNDKFADSYYGRGKVFLELGENKKAEKDFTKAIELREDWWEPYCERGLLYADTCKYERALSDLTKSLSLNPSQISLYYERAAVYFWLGRFEDAIKDLSYIEKSKGGELSLELAPEVYVLKGLSLIKLGRKEEGIKAVKKGIALLKQYSPKSAEDERDYDKIGYGFLILGEYQKALYCFSTEPDSNPHKFLGRAKAYIGLGQMEAAQRDLQKALSRLVDGWEKEETRRLLKNIEQKHPYKGRGSFNGDNSFGFVFGGKQQKG